ncbi:unnamed protein product [Durusdinium trenchii]|uniref:Uncharacterized protein n=1 Tax=Durusdinium trenchii TaxID=1381693 RepID=A0ABP0SRP7_9DINO
MYRCCLALCAAWLPASAVRPARSPYDEVSSLSVLEKDGFQRSRRMLRRLREAFGPEDVDEAAGISELTFYVANMTKEKCEELKQHKDNEKAVELLEKMKEVCEEEKTDGVVSKLQAKVSDPFVAQFLCGGLNFFTVKEMTYTELLQCQFAAHDVLGGLVECGEAAKTKNAALFALRFSLYAIKVSAIFLPLLPPLGLLIHKAADLALARLSKEVENQLDALEKKMDAKMQAMLTEELLRLGTAQARAAEEQVQEMSILDALWSDILEHSATSKDSAKFAAAMAHASSFNRWAIIEQDLSTSSEMLRPTSSMVNVQDRADFARLLKTQLEMYILVLSHMYRSAQESRHAQKFQTTLMTKAQRMARMLLPELLLLKRTSPDDLKQRTLEVLNSPLLLPAKSETCKEMFSKEEFYFEYMVTCIWFPLIHVAGPEASGNSSYAWPLTVGGVIEPISKSKDRCILYPDDSLFNAQKADRTKGYNVTCDGDDIIEELHQKYANNAVRKDKESIHFWCGQRWREHGITLFPGTVFQTPGLCLDFVRFFQYETLAVLTAVEFDEVTKGQRTGIKSSTCRLAYRSSEKLYGIPKDWSKLTHELHTDKVETLCEYLDRFEVVRGILM